MNENLNNDRDQKHKLILAAIASITCITILYTYLNFIWCLKNGVFVIPPWYDIAYYLNKSVIVYHQYLEKGLAGLFCLFADKAFFGTAHAPLLSTVTGCVYALLHSSAIQIAYSANAIYTAIFLTSIYLIASQYFGKKTAILSLFIFLTFPVVIEYSRSFLPYYSLASYYMLTLYFLLKSSGFRSIGYSLAFGLSAALISLEKTYGIGYLIGPMVIGFLWALKTKEKRSIFLYFTSISLSLLIAVPWYLANLRGILPYLARKMPGSIYDPHEDMLWAIENWTYLVKRITTFDFSIYYSLLFAWVLVSNFLIRWSYKRINLEKSINKIEQNKNHKKFYAITVFSSLILYVLCSISWIKTNNFQYALAIGPVIAIILANLILTTRLKVIKSISIGFTVIIGLLNYSMLQLNVPKIVKLSGNSELLRKGLIPRDRPHLIWWMKYGGQNFSDWNINEIITLINSERENTGMNHASVYLPFDHHYFYVGNFNYFTTRMGLERKIIYYVDNVYPELKDDTSKELIEKNLDRMDYVVVKTGIGGFPLEQDVKQVAGHFTKKSFPNLGKIVMARLHVVPNEFEKIYDKELPDNTRALVYKRSFYAQREGEML